MDDAPKQERGVPGSPEAKRGLASTAEAPKPRRRLLPRFSLRSLTLCVLLAASSFGLWWNWAPWCLAHSEHSEGVTFWSLDFSPDGKELLEVGRGLNESGTGPSNNIEVSVRDAASGVLQWKRTVEMTADAMYIQWSASSTRLFEYSVWRAYRGPNPLRAVWSAERGEVLFDLDQIARERNLELDSLVFAEEGDLVVYPGAAPADLVVENLSNGHKVTHSYPQASAVHGILSDNGKWLVSVSGSGGPDAHTTTISFGPSAGGPRRQLDFKSAATCVPLVAPDERTMALQLEFLDGSRRTSLVDLATGDLLGDIPYAEPLSYSMDGWALMTRSTSDYMWVRIGQQVYTRSISSLEPGFAYFSGDGTAVLAANRGEVACYDAASGNLRYTVQLADDDNYRVSADASVVASLRERNDPVVIYREGEEVARIPPGLGDRTLYGLAPGGDQMVLGEESDKVEVWERRRDEGPWGIVALPEFWLTAAFALALGWSLVRDFKTLRKKQG